MSILLNTDPLLPDIIDEQTRLLIIGLALSPKSAETGHYYADSDEQFYALMYHSGLVSEDLTPRQDRELLNYHIGLTNLIKNKPITSTREINPIDHSIGEIIRTIFDFQPEIVCFNGELAYTHFYDRRGEYGLQKVKIGDAKIIVVPDSNIRRCEMTFEEKLAYYEELNNLLRG